VISGLHVVGLSGSALFQDAGRHHVDSGVPVAGAFDRDAHIAATALVGGSIEQASLEVVGMIDVVADRPMTCAVTGRATVTVDGRPAAPWTALDVPAGAQVQVLAGGRAYLSVAGGFQPATVLGSRSTCLLGPIGPAPLGIGDLVPLAETCTSGTVGDFIRAPERRAGVRVVPGPHLRVTACEVRVLEASRIGVRLTAGTVEGAAVPARSDLPSLGVLPGTLQVLPSGDWMLLGPDAGTMGGYPVAGVVTTADLGTWAHVLVDDLVHLEVIDASDAPDPAAPALVRVQGLGG
jgi:allophanate hydrolase subunit 2